MKTLNNIFFCLAAVSLFAVSCVKSAPDYVEGEKELESGVYFLSNNPYEHTVESTDRSYTYYLGRYDASSALTVNILSDSDSRIVAPSTVTFNAGEKEAALTVTFSEALPSSDVKVALSIAPENAALYGPAAACFNGVLNCKWKTLGIGYFFDPVGLAAESGLQVVPVTIKQSLVEGDSNHYLIADDPYADDALLIEAWGESYLGGTKNPKGIDFWVSEDNHVTWDECWYTGLIYTEDGDKASTIKAYLPSALSSSQAPNDALSVFDPEGLVVFAAYFYIDGLGGFGINNCYLGLPNAFSSKEEFEDFLNS